MNQSQVPEDFDPTGYGYNYEEQLGKLNDKFAVVCSFAIVMLKATTRIFEQ